MKLLMMASLSLFLISCATGPGKRKGPSPYSAFWIGEPISPSEAKSCPADQAYTKLGWKALVEQAGQCVRSKNYIQAERIANHLAKVEPESHWGAYFLSLTAESRKDYPRAFWMIELALKKSPEDGILLFQRGRLNWSAENHALALKDLEQAVSKNPNISEAHLLLGQVQFTKDELSKAQASFSKALSQNPKGAEALFGLGEIAFKNKKYEEAYDYHKRASKIDSRLGISFLRMAQIQEIHHKDLTASLSAYKDLERRVALNRVEGKLPLDIADKVKALNAQIQQSVAAQSEGKPSAANREPTAKKVSK